jgi:hypothetical protein
MTEINAQEVVKQPERPKLLKIMRPGLITGACDDDLSGIAIILRWARNRLQPPRQPGPLDRGRSSETVLIAGLYECWLLGTFRIYRTHLHRCNSRLGERNSCSR